MKRNKTNLLILFVMLTMSFAGRAQTALAQNALAPQNPHNDVKTDSRILYHNGPVLSGAQDIYLIWYGCWANDCGLAGDTASQFILSDFMSSLGSTPYFQINAGYPNSSGQAPSGYTGLRAEPGPPNQLPILVKVVNKLGSFVLHLNVLAKFDLDKLYYVFLLLRVD